MQLLVARRTTQHPFASRRDASIHLLDASLRDAKWGFGDIAWLPIVASLRDAYYRPFPICQEIQPARKMDVFFQMTINNNTPKRYEKSGQSLL